MENRETFFNRLKPIHPPSVLLNIELAYTLAKFAHRFQTRKECDDAGKPVRYFEHVRRVAIVLMDDAKIMRPEMIISALLHDSIEDTRDLTPELMEHCFGSDVVSIVKVLSKTPKEGYLDRFNMCTDWRPYLIKACDRLDNLRSLKATAQEHQKKILNETKEKYVPLFKRMIELAPKEHLVRTVIMAQRIEAFINEAA